MQQAGMGFAQSDGPEQFVGVRFALEGVMGKAEVGEIHQRVS
jgi:hypothetical protein